MKYIDIHSHLNSADFDADREAVMARMAETDTGTIVVGTDFESSKRAVEIAEANENVWASIGIHPVDNLTEAFDPAQFEDLMTSPKVVAVGECGLDYFHADINDAAETARQEALFRAQIDFALKHDKPVMIHSRAAYPELLAMLEPLKAEKGEELRGDVHFFAGTLQEAERFWQIGFTTSFTGVITFARNYDEVIKNAPLEMLMSETDAPYVSPVPYRGKRNEPSYVPEVVKKLAEIRGDDPETVRKAMLANANRLFGLGLA